MTLTRWEPMRELVSLREAMDRLFEDSFIRPSTGFGDAHPLPFPVDLYETTDSFVLQASLPGMRPEDLEINATTDGVAIRGELKQESEVKQEAWLRQERRHGKFQRSFTFPVQVDSNKVEATFEHGVLTLTLPKAEAVKPKQIKVKPIGIAVEAQPTR